MWRYTENFCYFPSHLVKALYSHGAFTLPQSLTKSFLDIFIIKKATQMAALPVFNTACRES